MSVIAELTSPACPRCGTALPGDAPAGLCPRCLLSDGFGDQSEGDFRLRTGQPGPRFVPPTIEELAVEFPNLEFLQLLGSGGMGAVYLAKQIRLDRRVAVKILPPDLADDPAFAERFLREARALARLSHPSIVGVYDFGQTPGGLYYFLMEYIDGPTLRQVVANRSTEPKQALEIVRQVCDALQFAHDKGVVHRDIKPENILLDAQGRVKIADFGLAKLLGLAEPQPGSPAAGSLTHTRQAMGTPHYMAPEQIAGSRGVDHRADIYSLGVVFYELLTGDLPVGRFAPPSKKVQIDVRLDEVVLRSLEAEPAQRYQRASDVKTDVETISAGRPATPPAAVMQFVSAGVERGVHSASPWAARGETSQLAHAALLLVAAWFALVLVAVVLRIALVPAAMAAIASTIIGWLAIQEIRRSGAQRSGLVAATSATVALPLLLIVVGLWALCLIPGLVVQENIFNNYKDEDAIALGSLFAVPVCLIVGFLFVRWAWGKATAGLPADVIERELSIIPPGLRSFFSAIPTPFDRARNDQQASPRSNIDQPSAVDQQAPDLRQESSAVAASPAPNAAAVRPRTSIKAIIAAIWAAAAMLVGVLVVLSMMVVADVRHGAPAPASPIMVFIVPIGLLVAAIVVPAPFVVTLLGWSAVSDIRNSAGRLKGLPLAVFDGLFFPLLLLDALIVVLLMGATGLLAWSLDRVDVPQPVMILALLIGTMVQVAACAVIDTLIVRAVWRRVKPASPVIAEPPDTANSERESWIEPVAPRRHRDLVMAGVAITIAVLLIGLQLLFENGFPGSQHATVDYNQPVPATAAPTSGESMAGAGGAITEEDRDRGWRMGPAGPEVLPQWFGGTFGNELGRSDSASSTLKQIDAALHDVYADYERVLDEHTTATLEGDAVVFKVEPFPEELDRLANEFWSRVDPLFNVDQQTILRYNFPLRYEQRHRARGRHDHFVLPIGDGRWTIRIERFGQWYRWSATYPNSPPGSYDRPRLPSHLRRFQYQFDRLTSLRNDGLTFDPQRLPLVAPKPAGMASPAGSLPESPPGFAGMEMMSGAADMSAMSGMEIMSGSAGMNPMPGMGDMNVMPGYADMGAMSAGMDMYGDMAGQPAGTEGELPLADRLQQWGLDPKSVAAVIDVVNQIERNYHTVLDEHTQVHVNGTSVTFSTRPFPEQIEQLERRFWEQVDPLLNVEQQRILRNSFPVGEPWYPTRDAAVGRMGSGFDPHSSTKPSLLMIGHGVTHLSIARVGQWYRWQLKGGDVGESMYIGPSQETPSLPRWLSHFQDRYDELVPRSK